MDFPGGPVVKNLPCNAGVMGSIPDWGTKIPHSRATKSAGPDNWALTPQLDSLCAAKKDPAAKILCATTKTWCCCCSVASVVSDSMRPHGLQPTKLLRPWDSPGKNTGVGCHLLLQVAILVGVKPDKLLSGERERGKDWLSGNYANTCWPQV